MRDFLKEKKKKKKKQPNNTCRVSAQIIEKRRRDRINNSLSELRRLVPSAFEKQVSNRQPKV